MFLQEFPGAYFESDHRGDGIYFQFLCVFMKGKRKDVVSPNTNPGHVFQFLCVFTAEIVSFKTPSDAEKSARTFNSCVFLRAMMPCC